MNIAELRSHRKALLRRLHDIRRIGCQAVYLLDSGAGVGALAKGRSSLPAMNADIKKCAACRFAGGYRDFYIWCASGDISSDLPSRKYPSKMKVRSGVIVIAPIHFVDTSPQASGPSPEVSSPRPGERVWPAANLPSHGRVGTWRGI